MDVFTAARESPFYRCAAAPGAISILFPGSLNENRAPRGPMPPPRACPRTSPPCRAPWPAPAHVPARSRQSARPARSTLARFSSAIPGPSSSTTSASPRASCHVVTGAPAPSPGTTCRRCPADCPAARQIPPIADEAAPRLNSQLDRQILPRVHLAAARRAAPPATCATSTGACPSSAPPEAAARFN